MLVKRRAPEVLRQAAGDRLVEGEPMVAQVADNGRLMQRAMRKIDNKRTKRTKRTTRQAHTHESQGKDQMP